MPNGDDNGGGKSLNEAASDQAGELVGWIIGILLLARLLERLPQIIENIEGRLSEALTHETLLVFYQVMFFITGLLAVAFASGTVYAVIRTNQIRRRERERMDEITQEALAEADSPVNRRWLHVENLIDSDNEREWRMAIIEADVMLDEMLTALGYTQDSVGDKLQSINKGDFASIDAAWEAHKMRNIIAHQGSNYNLTAREAQQTIDLYRQVFEEFSYL